MLYPWLNDAYEQLTALTAQERLPHALLLVGPAGLGKQKMALTFSQFLHCQSPLETRPCNSCDSCALFNAGSHPDHLFVTPEEAGKAILINQIRQLVEFSHHTAKQGGYRTIVVSPAERMNWNAQNALLKTLEEPGTKTLLLLVTEQLNQLLPTVISRCQQRNIQAPSLIEGAAWLGEQKIEQAEANGLLLSARYAPLHAMALREKPWFKERETIFTEIATIQQNAIQLPRIAKKLSEFEGQELLPVLYHWVAHAIKAQQGALTTKDEALVAGIDAFAKLQPQRVFAFQEAILRALQFWLSGANPNKEILYEQLLMVLLGVPLARDIVHAY